LAGLVSLLLVGLVSALVPLVNIEAYLGVRAALVDIEHLWLLGLVAALGQMVGKLVWFYIGASSLDWGWVRRKIDRPKAQSALEKWRRRTHERPVFAGSLLFSSAMVGVPPFAILAVLAGQLRMNVALFLTLGLMGRWLRFVGVIGGVQWLGDI
jgi:membrane protein YqaA with SNARE-associated domain